MNKKLKILLIIAIALSLLVLVGIAVGATTISQVVLVSPNTTVSVDVTKAGTILYSVDVERDSGGINQIAMYKSVDGGAIWTNYTTTKWITTSAVNKFMPRLLSLTDSGLIAIFYAKSGVDDLFYRLYDGSLLGGEYGVNANKCDLYAGGAVRERMYDVSNSPTQDAFNVVCENGWAEIYYTRINYTSASLISTGYKSVNAGYYGLRAMSVTEYSPTEIWMAAAHYHPDSLMHTYAYKSTDGGSSWTQQVDMPKAYYFTKIFITTDGRVLLLYSDYASVGSIYGVWWDRDYNIWYNLSSFISDAGFKDGIFGYQINLFERYNNVYFPYSNNANGLNLGYWNNGTSSLNTRSLSNNTNYYLAIGRGSNYPFTNNIGSTSTIVSAKSDNTFNSNGYNFTSYTLNMLDFSLNELGEYMGGYTGVGANINYCTNDMYNYYRYLRSDWMPSNASCIFADNFEYYNDVYLQMGWEHSYPNCLQGTANLTNSSIYGTYWDFNTRYSMKSAMERGNCSTYYGIGNSNVTFITTKTFPNYIVGGTYVSQFTMLMEGNLSARWVMGYYADEIPLVELFVGVNNSNGNAFVWYMDRNTENWKRMTTFTDCDVWYGFSVSAIQYKIEMDFSRGIFNLFVMGNRKCAGGTPDYSGWRIIGSNLPLESSYNYVDRVDWYQSPEAVVPPADFVQTLPTNYYGAYMGDFLIYQKGVNIAPYIVDVYSQVAMPVCININVPIRAQSWYDADGSSVRFSAYCDLNNSMATWTGWYPFTIGETILVCRYSDYGNYTARVFIDDGSQANPLLSYKDVSIAVAPYDCNINPTIYNPSSGTQTTGGNVTIPIQTSQFGDDLAVSLGLGSANLKAIASLIGLILLVGVITWILVSNGIQGGAVMVVDGIFAVFGLIFFFLIGWIPFWIIFLLVILAGAIFGLTIKGMFVGSGNT